MEGLQYDENGVSLDYSKLDPNLLYDLLNNGDINQSEFNFAMNQIAKTPEFKNAKADWGDAFLNSETVKTTSIDPKPGTEEWKATHGNFEKKINDTYSTKVNLPKEEQIVVPDELLLSADTDQINLWNLDFGNEGQTDESSSSSDKDPKPGTEEWKATHGNFENKINDTYSTKVNLPKEEQPVVKDELLEVQPVAVDILLPLSELPDIKSGYKFNEDDTSKVKSALQSLIDNSETLKQNIDTMFNSIIANLCDETKRNVDFESVKLKMYDLIVKIIDKLEESKSNVEWRYRAAKSKDTDKGHSTSSHSLVNVNIVNDNTTSNETTTETSNVEEINDLNDTTNTTDTTDSVTDNNAVSDSVTGEQNEIVTDNINKAILGTITFVEVLPLFEQLGANSTASSNLSTTYELNGIKKYNDKYYYEIKEKANDKLYYTEVSDKVKLESNITDILEVKNTTVKIDTPDLNNDNNYAEVLNENDVFLVTGKETYNGDRTIELARVFDSSHGKEGYIMISDNVEIKSIDSLINVNS